MPDSPSSRDENTSPSDESEAATSAVQPEPASERRRVEDLPNVEPPSAGFIVQLFLIPMIIVGAIIGVYLLFGKLASGDQDWRTLVAELRSGNKHRGGRAAMGLAHLLSHDQQLGDEGQQLARNPEIANALVEVLAEQRKTNSSRQATHDGQAYMVTALGYMDQPKIVIPPLQKVMRDTNEDGRDLRMKALTSLSLISFRVSERAKAENRPLLVNELVEVPLLIDDVIRVTQDSEPLFRHMGCYVLGLLPSPESQQRLEVLLGDDDHEVQVNAAIGLARQSSTAGWPVFLKVLSQGEDTSTVQAGMELVILKNSLKAVQDLDAVWSAEQKAQLLKLVESIAQNHPESRIRSDAVKTLQTLQGTT